jgi:hypothetical protein
MKYPMRILSLLKYFLYSLLILSILIFASFFSLRAWLNNELLSKDIDISFTKNLISQYIITPNNNINYQYDKIELKNSNDRVLLLLSEVKISDEINKLDFYANEIEITNSLLDRVFGPLKGFFNTTGSVNNYVISNPEFTIELDNDAQSNNEIINNNKETNNEEIFLEDSIAFLGDLSPEFHFYQPALYKTSKLINDIKSIFADSPNSMVLVKNATFNLNYSNQKYKFNYPLVEIITNEEKVELKTSATPSNETDDQLELSIYVSSLISSDATDLDITFKNINLKKISENINLKHDIDLYDGGLSGRFNLSFNKLGRVIKSNLDLNIGEGIVNFKLPYSKSQINNLNDAYFSLSFQSATGEITINEMRVYHDDFKIAGNGKANIKFANTGSIDNFEITLVDFILQKRDSVILDKSIIYISYDSENNGFSFNEITGKLPLGDLILTSEIKNDFVEYSLEINNTDSSNLKKILNLFPANNTSRWFNNNVNDAQIIKLNATRKSYNNDDNSNDQLDLNIDFSQADFRYFKNYPNIQNAKGNLILNGKEISVQLDDGNILLENSSKVKIRDSSGKIFNVNNKYIADFEIQVDCSIQDCIEYFNEIGLNKNGLLDLQDRISGDASVNASVLIDTSLGFTLESIKEADLNVESFSFRLNDESVFMSPLATFNIQDKKISSSGEFNFSGIQSTFDILADFSQLDPKLEVVVKAQPSPTELSILQPILANYISGLGRIPTEIQINLPLGDIRSFDLNSFEKIIMKSDLTDVSIKYPILESGKLTNERAQATLTVDRPTNDGEAKYKIEYDAQDFVFELLLRRKLNEVTNEWDFVNFEVLNLSSSEITNAQIFGYIENNVLIADVIAKEAEVSDFVRRNLFSTDGDNRSNIKNLPDMRILVQNIDKVSANNRDISLLSGEIIIQNKKLYRMQLDGFFNGDTNRRIEIKYNLEEEGLPADLGVNTSDAGAFLGFLGLYQNGFNGSLQIRSTGPNINNMTGEIFIEDIDIYNDKYLARLFAQSSPSDLIDINRTQLDSRARYRIIDENLVIDSAELFGDNVKFELSGQLNNETGSLKLPGTYCPEYELNASFGTIPIFGPVLTGGDDNCVFSLPFQIVREARGEPTLLRLNTTGMFAPGILRDAFDYN